MFRQAFAFFSAKMETNIFQLFSVMETGNEKKKCHCESLNCSGFLGVRPKTQNAQLQESKIKKAAEKKKKKKPKKVVVKEG